MQPCDGGPDENLQEVFAERWSSTAAAIAAPSHVAVPRPSSSRATRLAGVALLRAAAVSASSTKKVDWPDMTSSLAPMRTKIASTGVRVREWAGTHAPTWAMRAARHTCTTCTQFVTLHWPYICCKKCKAATPQAIAAQLHLPDYTCIALSVLPVTLAGSQVYLQACKGNHHMCILIPNLPHA